MIVDYRHFSMLDTRYSIHDEGRLKFTRQPLRAGSRNLLAIRRQRLAKFIEIR